MQNLTMHRSDWIAIALILGATICSIAMIVFGANGCTPAEGQNRAVEAKHEGDLGWCITEAAKLDASHDARYAEYTKCADDADRDAGRKP